MFLRSQNVHFAGLRLDDVAFIGEDVHREMRASCVLSGDVLLNITERPSAGLRECRTTSVKQTLTSTYVLLGQVLGSIAAFSPMRFRHRMFKSRSPHCKWVAIATD